MSPTQRLHDEAGETLVELLIAVAILGIAAVAILAGFMVTVKTSDQNRKQTTSGAYVRSWAEAIQTSNDAVNRLQTCGDYEGIFASSLQTLTSAQNQVLAGLVPSCSETSRDKGMQQVVLRVTGPSGRSAPTKESLTVFLRTPCTATGATPCS